MGKNYMQRCYNDAHSRFESIYRSYEKEFQSEETQAPDDYLVMFELPVKRTYFQMASIKSYASIGQSSSHEASPTSQSNKLTKYLTTN